MIDAWLSEFWRILECAILVALQMSLRPQLYVDDSTSVGNLRILLEQSYDPRVWNSRIAGDLQSQIIAQTITRPRFSITVAKIKSHQTPADCHAPIFVAVCGQRRNG